MGWDFWTNSRKAKKITWYAYAACKDETSFDEILDLTADIILFYSTIDFFQKTWSNLVFPHLSRVSNIYGYCGDSRPRARWYQLRGLPLKGSECVCPQCNSHFDITRGSAKPSPFGLPFHLSTEKVELPSQQNSNRQMPNGTTTAVQHPPKANVGLPTTSWRRPSSFNKPNCPYVGQ